MRCEVLYKVFVVIFTKFFAPKANRIYPAPPPFSLFLCVFLLFLCGLFYWFCLLFVFFVSFLCIFCFVLLFVFFFLRPPTGEGGKVLPSTSPNISLNPSPNPPIPQKIFLGGHCLPPPVGSSGL